MKRSSASKKKKTYLEHMAEEKTKKSTATGLPFLSGFSRNMSTKHVEIVVVRNEDELSSIFSKIQSQLNKFQLYENDTLEKVPYSRARSNTTRGTVTAARLLDSTEDSKSSFGIELDSFGGVKVGTIKEQRYYPINNHVGDVSSLIDYSHLKSIRSRASFKSVTTWNSSTSPRSVNRPFTTVTTGIDKVEVPSSASMYTIEDFDEFNIDLNLLKNFQVLIQFCFKALGKSGSDCPKLPLGFDFFTVLSVDPIKISFTNTENTYTVEDVLAKLFSYIAKSVQKCSGQKTKKLIVAIPPEYGILEKTELKKSLERADLEVMRILSIPIAKSVFIALREQREGGNISDKIGKHMLVDFSPGAINVALYETTMYKPLKITSSLINQQYSANQLLKDFVKLLKSKLSASSREFLDNDPESVENYIDDVEESLKKGEEATTLISPDDESFVIKKSEIENILQIYSYQTIRLLNAILTEQNICRKSDIKRIDIFSSIFPNAFGNILKNKFIKIADSKNIFIDLEPKESNSNTITNVAKLAKKMAVSGKDYLDQSLSSSLGTGDYRGIFFKHLKRGVTLPFSETTTTTTIHDNQESLLVEIFQGERPLTRYCALLGSLNVTDLPHDKAEKVTVEVTLSIDRDEVLTVKAKELKTNKKLTAVIEKTKQIKLNIDNMVVEAIDNKINDEKLVTKLNEIDKLVEIIRRKYTHQNKIMEKMTQIVDRIAENEQTIDIHECDAILVEIKDFFHSRKTSKHEQHN